MKTLRRLGTLPVVLAVVLSSPAHKALADQQPLDRPPRYEEKPEDPEKKREEQEKAEKAREEERQARERERERQAGEDEQRRRDQENRNRDEERRNQEEQARERERRAREEDQRREDQRREDERRRAEDARREERDRRDREDERRREEDARREERERRAEEERQQRQAEEDRRREDEARREREREERERGRDYYPPVYPEPTPPRYYPDPDPIPVYPPAPAPEPDDGSEGVYNCAAQFGPHCNVFSFWWAKPHREVKFRFQNGISLRQVKYLKLMSIMTNGLRGRTGTLGITEAKILLSNGGKIDAFKLAKKQFPQRVSKKGQLFLRSEGDMVTIPLPKLSANVKAVGVYIKADSWINPQTPAYLQVWFDSLNSQPLQLLKP